MSEFKYISHEKNVVTLEGTRILFDDREEYLEFLDHVEKLDEGDELYMTFHDEPITRWTYRIEKLSTG